MLNSLTSAGEYIYSVVWTRKRVAYQPTFLKVDQDQPHKNVTAVKCVKTKPRIAEDQIHFGGIRLGSV